MQRHVVLGANTFIGALCVKLLITIGENIEIVAVTTGEQLAPDIPLDQITVIKGTILDPIGLYEILEKDDIVYHAQVYFEEKCTIDELEHNNHLGLMNLLGVSSLLQVKRIVTFLPQMIGWDLPDELTEKSEQRDPDPEQQVTKQILDMLHNYWRRKPYGWNSRNIRAWAKQNIKTPKVPIIYYEDEELGFKELDEESVGDLTNEEESTSDEDTIAPEVEVDNQETQNDNDEIDENLEVNTDDDEQDEEDTVEVLDEAQLFWKRQEEERIKREEARKQIEVDLARLRSEREKREERDRELRRRELPRVPLVVARFGRIFGAYDNGITVNFCDAVKRGSMQIIGEMDQLISWITPVDIGRAIIILSDRSVPQGEYFLNSFIASPRQILAKLDEINASHLKLEAKNLEKELYRLRIKNFLSRYHIGKYMNPRELLKYNTRQVFSDEKARKRWKWHPRYNDVDKACEEAFQWYFEVIVPKRYPLN